jgi:soluble lytic murein transglycosylase-like protein
MSSRASRALVWMVVAVALGLAAATPASAQIYAIRDENGVLTLSDKPLGAGAQTYAVRGASSEVRVTRGSSGDGSGVRSSQWDDVIDYHAREQGIRPDLVRAVIQVESAFNPRARSHKGAMGLMQLMPATARELGVRNAYDPLENIRGGVLYLRGLLDQFAGNEELALAAYNAGPGAVTKYGGTVPPYRETRDYVTKIQGKAGTSLGSRSVIYRITELIDGEEVVRYSNQRPPRGTTYEIVQRRRAVE